MISTGRGQYNGQWVYCGLSTACEVFIIFTTQLYQYFSVFFLFALFSDEPEVFLPEYYQTAILHAAHFWRVVRPGVSKQINSSTGLTLVLAGLSQSFERG